MIIVKELERIKMIQLLQPKFLKSVQTAVPQNMNVQTVADKALVLLLIILTSVYSYSQKPEPKQIVPEWAEMDITGVSFVMGLMPIENRRTQDVEKLFNAFQHKNASWSDKSSLGFGAERIKLSMGLGYTTVYIDYLTFKDRIVHYKIGADVSADTWKTHGQKVMRAWKDNGGPNFEVKDSEMIFEKDFSNAWTAYYSEISRELGDIKSVEIPQELEADYKLLTDPFENSNISFVACSDGKPAIDSLEDTKRIDLIENVLRSYNPGGRIYAAISLLRMAQKGHRLTAATKQSIDKVMNSDASVTTCWGDTGISGLKAKDVIPEYVKSKDWMLLRRQN